jgi:hypothetical protein
MSGVTLKWRMSPTDLPFQDPYIGSLGDGFDPFPGVQSVKYTRGAPNEYGQFEPGTSEVVVSDPDSDLDINNPDSRFASYVQTLTAKPTRGVIEVDDGVTTTVYPLFQHFIDRIPRTQKVGGVWTQRTVECVDAFGLFALAGIKAVSYPSEATGARFGRVLDDIGWPAGRRDIDTGNATLDAYTNDADSSDKALQHLLAVISNEDGAGFMAADGTATFIERHAALTNTTVRAIFADDRSLDTGSYPTAFRYTELQPEDTEIFNDYTGSRAGGSVMTSTDTQSQGTYGPRSASPISFLVADDNQVQDALDWRLSRTKDMHERVDSLTIMPGDDLDLWATCLSLEIGDQVQVVEYPSGYTAPVVTQYIIRHLAGDIPLAIGGSSFTFQLTPASIDNWLVLDDATFGQLDANKLAY